MSTLPNTRVDSEAGRLKTTRQLIIPERGPLFGLDLMYDGCTRLAQHRENDGDDRI